MTWDWDDKLKKFSWDLNDSMDTILLGRKMTKDFITHWEATANKPEDPEQDFAKIMVERKKIVFSRSQKTISGINTSITNEDVVTTVNKLKNQPGKDIIVYGGANFVSSLIESNLIDEYYLFIDPTAIGNGLKIFKNRTQLQLKDSIKFDCGIVVNKYIPAK